MNITVRVEPIENWRGEALIYARMGNGEIIKLWHDNADHFRDHKGDVCRPTHYLPDGFPSIPTEEHPLAEVRFGEATVAQFKEFWEAQKGWKYQCVDGWWRAIRDLNNSVVASEDWQYIVIDWDGEIDLHYFSKTYTTFGEALDAVNKIADALGGWAEVTP